MPAPSWLEMDRAPPTIRARSSMAANPMPRTWPRHLSKSKPTPLSWIRKETPVAVFSNSDGQFGGLGVLADIGERFLNNPVNDELAL